MHEFSIASLIVESLLDLVKKQGAKRVLEVHLQIGQLRALSAEQVKFSYGILTKGTKLQDSNLLIREVAANAHCLKCGYDSKLESREDMAYHFALPSLACPKCGDALTITGGDECTISKVKMELPTKNQVESTGAQGK